MLNGANARLFRLALGNGAPFTLIRNDGGLLVDFRGLPVGTKVMLQELNAGWDLLEFRVARQVSVGSSIPTGTLSTIPKLSNPGGTREFSFEGMSHINGQVYDL